MSIVTVLGSLNLSITFTNRPTVKALIFNDASEVLLINDGLLPGGGVEPKEDNLIALVREIQEEVGLTVSGIEPVGTVIQYRKYLEEKYIINGYKAAFKGSTGRTTPKDAGEADFKLSWYQIETALELVQNSITELEKKTPTADDAYEGKLFNLMTTRAFLEAYKSSL